MPAGQTDLTPGWHDVDITYANRAGTNFLAMNHQYAWESGLTPVALSDLRSFDENTQLINGLRGDYYSSLGGSYLFTRFGEGPIVHGATSFVDEIYEGNPGLWAGVFGPSATFAEHLTGQVQIGAPEPADVYLMIGGALLLLVRRRMARNGSSCFASPAAELSLLGNGKPMSGSRSRDY